MADFKAPRLPPHLSPNLEAIAKNAPTPEINTLIKLCFLAVNNRPEKKAPNAKDYALSQEKMTMIIASLGNAAQSAQQSAPQSAPSPPRNVTGGEGDIYLEERLNQTRSDLSRLEAEYQDLQEQSEDYRAERDRLKEELIAAQNHLEDSKSTVHAHMGSGREQRDEISRLETLIEEQEGTIRSNAKVIEDLQKSNTSFEVNAKNVQELQDEIRELRLERTTLKRTANAAAKYKEKLKSQGDFEEENKTLREEIKQLQDEMAQLKAVKVDPQIEKSQRELQRVLSAQEIQLQDYATDKQRLQYHNDALEEKNQLLMTQNKRDREEIEELQERLANASSSSSPTTPKAPNRDPDVDRIQETARYNFIFQNNGCITNRSF